MGWRDRAFHLGVPSATVYDRAGNGLPTAWWCGRIVGDWTQRPDGSVTLSDATALPRDASAALDREAHTLSHWLDGHVITTNFQQPLRTSNPVSEAHSG